jgi:hypothetical protein
LLWRPNSARPDEVLLADGRAEQGPSRGLVRHRMMAPPQQPGRHSGP